MEEALCHRVIPTVALAAHTRLHPVLGQEVPIAVGAILTAALGMHDQSRGGLPLTDGHRQGLGQHAPNATAANLESGLCS